jgi:hypothetical protein
MPATTTATTVAALSSASASATSPSPLGFSSCPAIVGLEVITRPEDSFGGKTRWRPGPFGWTFYEDIE